MKKTPKKKSYRVQVYPQPEEFVISETSVPNAIKKGLAKFQEAHPSLEVAGVNAKESKES